GVAFSVAGPGAPGHTGAMDQGAPIQARRPVETERRRLLQPLWNALDVGVAPALPRGVLLAISGGPDSRALMEAVARWPRRFDPRSGEVARIEVASVDHGARPEAQVEVEAVCGRARALGFVPHALGLAP